MPAPKGNKNAKGNKGGTGRPSLVDEVVRADVVNRSWNRIKAKFTKKKKTTEDERYLDQVAVEIAKKTIPQKIEGDLNLKFSLSKLFDKSKDDNQ